MCFYILVAASSQVKLPAWAVEVIFQVPINVFVSALVTDLYSFSMVCPKSSFPISLVIFSLPFCRM